MKDSRCRSLWGGQSWPQPTFSRLDVIARAHPAKPGIREGNVCALTAMELTPTFQHEKTSMAVRYRPTLVIYHYQIDPDMGWMHARIQTWFPFCLHLCING